MKFMTVKEIVELIYADFALLEKTKIGYDEIYKYWWMYNQKRPEEQIEEKYLNKEVCSIGYDNVMEQIVVIIEKREQ